MKITQFVTSVMSMSLLLANGSAFGSGFSATVTLTTDYVFDGISQTGSDGAAQASLDYAHDSGWYMGVWASNVDFGAGDAADAEIDYTVGFSMPVSEILSVDLGAIYYAYAGVPSDGYDYIEAFAGITANENTSFMFWYSEDKDVYNGTAYRAKVLHSIALPSDAALTLEATYTDRVDLRFEYFSYRVGIGKSLKDFDLDLSYHDTDMNRSMDPDELADGRLVFSVSRTF